jgi:hypothetical protein
MSFSESAFGSSWGLLLAFGLRDFSRLGFGSSLGFLGSARNFPVGVDMLMIWVCCGVCVLGSVGGLTNLLLSF